RARRKKRAPKVRHAGRRPAPAPDSATPPGESRRERRAAGRDRPRPVRCGAVSATPVDPFIAPGGDGDVQLLLLPGRGFAKAGPGSLLPGPLNGGLPGKLPREGESQSKEREEAQRTFLHGVVLGNPDRLAFAKPGHLLSGHEKQPLADAQEE